MKSTYDLVILNRDLEHHIFHASWYDAVKKEFMVKEFMQDEE